MHFGREAARVERVHGDPRAVRLRDDRAELVDDGVVELVEERGRERICQRLPRPELDPARDPEHHALARARREGRERALELVERAFLAASDLVAVVPDDEVAGTRTPREIHVLAVLRVPEEPPRGDLFQGRGGGGEGVLWGRGREHTWT